MAGQAASYMAGWQAHPAPQGVHPGPRRPVVRPVMRVPDPVRVLGSLSAVIELGVNRRWSEEAARVPPCHGQHRTAGLPVELGTSYAI
jgi:hypothetical protein